MTFICKNYMLCVY